MHPFTLSGGRWLEAALNWNFGAVRPRECDYLTIELNEIHHVYLFKIKKKEKKIKDCVCLFLIIY